MSRSLVLLTVLLSLLLSSVALAQEVPLTGVQYGPAPFRRESPQMASDGTNFLVAWRDGRSGNGSGSVFAARISPDGRLLDEPTAIGIPDGRDRTVTGYTNSPPAVAWTGSVFIVAWTDMTPAMRFVRIDRDGHVLDTPPRSAAGSDVLSWNAAASTGDRTLIVRGTFSNTDGSDVLYATLFDSHGDVLIERIPISHRITDSGIVAASNGSGFLVAWLRWNGIAHTLVVATVSRSGVVSAEREINLSTVMPLIAANGSDYLVVYATAAKNVLMQRFDSNGNALGATTLPIKMDDLFMNAAIAPYGSGYLFAYTVPGDRSLHALLVDRDGGFLEWRSLNESGRAESTVALGSNGSATALVWPEADAPYAYPERMYARILESQSDGTLISRSAPTQSKVRVATNGNGYLAAFLKWPDGGELRVARVTVNGERLDAEGILIDDDAREPAQVVFDGSNYVVAWLGSDRRSVYVTRVSPDGTLPGVHGTVVIPSCTAFGIGSNGTETLLVWNVYDASQKPAIFAQRMKQDGTLDPAVMQIPSRERAGSQFSIAWSHGTWLVAWREHVLGGNWQFPLSDYNVLAARISDGGTVLDGVPIVIGAAPDWDTAPAVATNGRDFLVAWRELRDVFFSAILARRVGFDGIAGSTIEVARGAGRNAQVEELSAVAAGSSYIVAWEDAGDLFYSAVGSGIRMPLAASSDDERVGTLLPKSEGFTAFYERVATENLYGGVPRAFFRFVGLAPRNRVVRH